MSNCIIMQINIDEFSNRVLHDILRLQARVEVLEGTVLALIELKQPGSSDAFLKTLKEQTEAQFQKLLIDHPYLKDSFDQIVDEALPDD
ncbi:MAG: hypothetical protein R2764_01330 [Bacteroidales bacterium]